jgi:type II secretory pathway pseudopilin PulG
MSHASAPSASQRKINSEAGFNLIEAAIVLGIVGIIVGGIWVAASAAYNNMKLRDATSQILVIGQNLRSLLGNNPNDTSLLATATAVQMGLAPSNMIGPGNTLRSPWNTGVTIDRASGDNYVSIVYADLPSEACSGLLGRLSNSGASSGIRTIVVGTGTPVYTTVGTQDLSIDVADLASCSGAATQDVTVTVFTQ